MMRPATNRETSDYLNGYRAFEGAVETDEGLLLPMCPIREPGDNEQTLYSITHK